MARRGGSVGMVVLIVTTAIVLLLVARSWRSIGSEAIDVERASGGIVDDRGEAEAGDAVRRGELPDLQDARRETDEHSERLKEALAEIE